MVVDFWSLDFYIKDSTIYAVPEISILSKLDYTDYIQNYIKIWEQLINLPIKLNRWSSYRDKDDWIEKKVKYLNKSNKIISSMVWHEYFKIQANIDEDYIEIPLWLLVLSDIIDNDNWDRLEDYDGPLTLFVEWYVMSISSKDNDVSAPFATKFIDWLFTSKYWYRYEDMQDYCKEYVKQIHLYNQLIQTWEKSIKISDYIDPSDFSDWDSIKWKRIFTKERHNIFTNEHLSLMSEVDYYKEAKIDLNWEYFWDLFKYEFRELPFLNLGYILFNEFVLGNKCYWLFMDSWVIENKWFIKWWDREFSKDFNSFEIVDIPWIYIDKAIIDKRVLQVCFDNNQYAKVITPVTQYVNNQVSEFIETIKWVKELKDTFFKNNIIIKKQLIDVCEEILQISEFADKAEITIDLSKKELKSMSSTFTSKDLNKLSHLRDQVKWFGYVTPDSHGHKQTKLTWVKRRKLN